MATIAVIDYGMGNLRSVAKALEHVDDRARVRVTWEPEVIRGADRVILPGVGAIRECMSELQRLELDGVVREVAREKPFLGVCLGMQALLGESEENGGTAALGLVPGTVRHFAAGFAEAGMAAPGKVPHMGWNQVRQTRGHPLWAGVPDDSWFYFVHSYYVPLLGPDLTAGVATYGLDFTAVIARENIFATQFHPEKSQHAGLGLLANFTRWDGTD
ncbi:imidazole glycerol phosphate synthase subunit HisH [Aquisalimonas lutea]|uniref:imidazole glycerol phosphate synthase subunit HisH n=1 Tax=Aquisalimonas lutea TaxID=1327750 RepID=UPI0025B47694|nr:imidazole glycerol phosphate synthase subunit HisH [Aquisalimonas lutea]MDN3516708.1 imidazole glycerol phosphate synthase subunit HisH [Aquisalimonas lutea]